MASDPVQSVRDPSQSVSTVRLHLNGKEVEKDLIELAIPVHDFAHATSTTFTSNNTKPAFHRSNPSLADEPLLFNSFATTSSSSSSSFSSSPSSAFVVPEGYLLVDARPYEWKPPSEGSRPPYREHQGEGSQYLRDFILGINDGLISTLLIVVTMVAGGASCRSILLAAINASVAGAISMGLGEFVATKSQNDVVQGEKKVESEHFRFHRETEIAQLRAYLSSVGLEGPLLEACIRKIGASDEHLMRIMEKFEFGGQADEELERNPMKAMFMSGRLFFLGSLPSIVGFFQNDPYTGLWISMALSGASLFAVGVYKTRTTGGNPWVGGGENLVFAAIGTGVSYACGIAYNAARGEY